MYVKKYLEYSNEILFAHLFLYFYILFFFQILKIKRNISKNIKI